MGRKKTLERSINDHMAANQKFIPDILTALRAAALKRRNVKCPHCSQNFNLPGGGDVKAMMYLLDRHFGKPKGSLEIEAKKPSITGDDLVDIPKQIAAREVFLLGTIEGEYEVIKDEGIDGNGGAGAGGEDVCGEGGETQSIDDGGGESVGGVEVEVSISAGSNRVLNSTGNPKAHTKS